MTTQTTQMTPQITPQTTRLTPQMTVQMTQMTFKRQPPTVQQCPPAAVTASRPQGCHVGSHLLAHAWVDQNGVSEKMIALPPLNFFSVLCSFKTCLCSAVGQISYQLSN